MSIPGTKYSFGVNPIPFLFTILIGLGVWMLPRPETLEPQAWQMLAIFAATIFGIMSKALPMGGMALLALTVITATGTLTLTEALSGFSNPIIWLVVMAFLVAKSFVKTGLGFRIAYHIVSLFGKKSIGLAYGMTLTDLIMAPAIPSNSARAGGIVFPIIKSLALTFGSSPEQKTERKIGAYLIQTAYHANIITSAMFLTAMAANPMMAEMAEELGISMSWGTWALAALVPGIISLLLLPWILFKVYPPDIKETPEAKVLAKEHLAALGSVSVHEWITLGVFALMLVLWIFGGLYIVEFDPHYNNIAVRLLKSESTITALVGVSILIITGVLNWKDVTDEEGAWNTLFWFSILIMMAGFLTKLGIIGWISNSVRESVLGINWVVAYLLLVLGYFYSHYFFASSTAHASSMYAAFVMVGITAGVPPAMMAFALAFTSNLSACLTHYGTSPGPILYGAGYVDLGTWWKIGALMSIVHLIVWIGIGSAWWKVLGLW